MIACSTVFFFPVQIAFMGFLLAELLGIIEEMV